MRRRCLKKLCSRLKELQQQKLTRDALLLKIGAAKKEAGRSYFLVDIKFPESEEPINSETFTVAQKQIADRKAQGRLLSVTLKPGSPESKNIMGVLHPAY